MVQDFKKSFLGKTDLQVGRLGLAASYGAPAQAFEEAFEHGCNYFYLGSGRHSKGMKEAIRNLCKKGYRDKMVIAIHTYARIGILTELFFKRTLNSLGIDYADVLILGWHNRKPSEMLINKALQYKKNGLVNFLGLSGHNRSLFPNLDKKIFDLFHIRYNAAHRGAETEAFEQFTQDLETKNKPGIVTYTATRWGQLLKQKHMPENESALTASDCYRFVLSNPNVDICLTGPKNVEQMQQALTSLEMGPLNEKETNRIKRIGDHVRSTAKSFFA